MAKAQTLPEYLRKQLGYSATGAGKIFHALEWIGGERDGRNDPESWDSFWPTMTRQMPHRVMPANPPLGRGSDPAARRGAPPIMDWGPIGHPSEAMPDHKVVDHTIARLQETQDKPLFMACGIFRPHIPFYVPQEYFDLYPLEEIKLPDNPEGWLDRLPASVRTNPDAGAMRRKWHEWIASSGEWKKAVQGYLASVTFADAQVGRLLDGLEKSPHKDNTIIVLWSDHGAHDKETWEKYSLWHESTRVPLIFVAPGVTTPGSVCRQPASLLDIYPTLLELIDVPPPDDQLEGTSLLPQLRNPSTPKAPVVCTRELNSHAVISESHRYIRYSNGDEELYNILEDPAEWRNLAQDPAHDALKETLRRILPRVNAASLPRPVPARRGKARGQGKRTGKQTIPARAAQTARDRLRRNVDAAHPCEAAQDSPHPQTDRNSDHRRFQN